MGKVHIVVINENVTAITYLRVSDVSGVSRKPVFNVFFFVKC